MLLRAFRKYFSTINVSKYNSHLSDSSNLNESIAQRQRTWFCALLVAYNGEKYHGFESSLPIRDLPTIEAALFDALKASGCTLTRDHLDTGLQHYTSMSRTDRGVSAISQIISARLNSSASPDIINEHLPADIRILAISRVAPRFNARQYCDWRQYTYTIPTYAFSPPATLISHNYRIDGATLAHVRALFASYEGTHYFHSFTPGGRPDHVQMRRRVLECAVTAPWLHAPSGVEFLTVRVRGVSFIMSQIRRMVGLVVCACRGVCDAACVGEALTCKLVASTAPGLGLMLDSASFHNYDSAPWNVHAPLDWHDARHKIDNFRRYLVDTICTRDVSESVTFSYLQHLFHSKVGVSSQDRSHTLHAKTAFGHASKLVTSTRESISTD